MIQMGFINYISWDKNPCGNCNIAHPKNDMGRYRMRQCACFYEQCRKFTFNTNFRDDRWIALDAYLACSCCQRGIQQFVRHRVSNDWRKCAERSVEARRKCAAMMNFVEKHRGFKYQDYVKHMDGGTNTCLKSPNRCYFTKFPDGRRKDFKCRLW